MTTLPDILSGERQVLPADDILVAQTFQSQTEVFAERYVDLGLTSNMAISQLQGRKLISNRLYPAADQNGPELVAAGRLFRSNTDVGVTFTLTDRDKWGIPQPTYLESTLLTGTWISEAVVQSVPLHPVAPDGYTLLGPRAIAVADFNGDGLGDVAFHAGSTEVTGSETIVGTASVTSAPSSLRFGPKYVGGPACLDMKAADLNGDGKPELICLYHSADLLYVTVHTVDPTTLQVLDPPGNTIQIALWQSGDKARLAVGKFDDDMGDNEIAVVLGGAVVPGGDYCATDTYCPVYVIPIKVTIAAPPPTGTGEVSFARVPAVDIGPFINGSTGSGWKRLVGLELATGKLDWFGGNPRDQLVVAAGMNSDSHYKGYAAVVVNFTTDATNPMSISTDQVKASAYNNATASTTCLSDVAVGRFSPPPAPDENTAPTNSQVALLLGGLASGYSQQANCDKNAWNTVAYKSMSVGTYLVDPSNNYKIAQTSNTALPTGGAETGGITIAPPRMAVGDFQGRSLLLGQPIIMTVATQVQPQFVIGAPPMHLDYFTPPLATERSSCYAASAKVYGQGQEPTSGSGSTGAQGCIQNVSAYPGLATGGPTATCDYCAKFVTSTDATFAGWQESTTSHTWSNEGGGSTSYKFGSVEPNIIQRGGLQFELHGSAKVMHTNTQTTRDDVLKEDKVDLSTWTNTEDEVLYTVQDVYLYFYPVIGQTDDNGNPLYLHFSVPDQTHMKNAPASELLWFQPPHQVGNIFSYPGNEAQLLTDYPGSVDRSGPVWWASTSPTNAQITWIENDATTKTAGEVDKTEWNVGTSVTAAAYLGGGFSTKDTLKYDHNESTANQYTNTNKSTLAESKGFTVASVGLTKVANSAYGAEARILGSAAPTLASGYWDQPVPMPKPDGEAGEGFPDLTLDGPMQLVYTADMLSNSNDFHAGTLWTSVYSAAPDIALQHYKQFFWLRRDSGVSQSDVWMFVPLYDNIDLKSVYQADFLKMKGFFITPSTPSPSQGPQGPQMTMATAGDKLRLGARVYNYSLAGLPANATVKVRFYAHQLSADDAYHQVWADDGCILIGEDSVPIGGFRSDPLATTATNRTMAYTTFDTTGRGGQYLMFWVVAWAENADGTLVPELPQHGLSSKPPEGCPANSILGMPMEFYSNNVGFYEQPFHILANSLAAAPRPTAKPLQPFSLGALAVSPVSGERPYAGALWELEVPLQAGDQDAIGVHLEHAGQGPGGRVSNTRIIPFIEAGQTYADRLTFRPLWCGPHSALVTARPAFHDPVSATLGFEIACRPEDVTAFFNDVLTDASLAGIVQVNANGQVQGRLAALQRAVLTAERLANKGATRGACQQYSQALAHVADAGNGPVAQLLEDIIDNAGEQLGCW